MGVTGVGRLELGPVGKVGSDHSRGCREDRRGYRRVTFFCGPPPRMRGRLPRVWGRCGSMGTTPRVCGEDLEARPVVSDDVGPPPRMRGRLGRWCRCHQWTRTTPAYAGKTTGRGLRRLPTRDHPRVCGEDIGAMQGVVKRAGPPPRMRGRLVGQRTLYLDPGATPAYAGKTSTQWHT